MKDNAQLTELDAVLIAIWKTFHYSLQKAAVFSNMQDIYGQRPIKFIRAATTRLVILFLNLFTVTLSAKVMHTRL